MNNMLYDYELFKQGKHYIILETQEKCNKVMEELEILGFRWISGEKPVEGKGMLHNFSCIRMSSFGIRWATDEHYYIQEGYDELLPLENIMKTNKELTQEELFERIAHLISSGNLENELFDFYFSDTNIGFMTYYDLLKLLKGEGSENKETPMKPYYQDMTSSLGGVDDVSRTSIRELTCRQCDYAYLNDYINDYEYCAYCGQKLDWSDLE